MSTARIRLQRFDVGQGNVRELEDEVAADGTVCIFVNGEYYAALIASPTMTRELVIGHLIGEGVIKSVEEIREMEVEPLKVYVDLRGEVDLGLHSRIRLDLITTACGAPSTPLRAEQLEPLKIPEDVTVEAAAILNMISELNRRSLIFRRTGGTHSAMLCSLNGDVLAFAEDVGRHNAVDKAVGSGALAGLDMSRCVLLSSGRQSSDIVLKAARSGIPIIASVAGPLESGIRVAQAAGITLVCFVRGKRMNVYTHSQRISMGAGEGDAHVGT